MIFSSTLFLFLFLPLCLGLYYAVPRKYTPARNALLLAASLLFYAWGEPRVIVVMLVSIAVNYGWGLLAAAPEAGRRRFALGAAISFNLAMLGYFKYANFFAQNVNAVFGTRWVSNVALPIGISFFTFQIMSYVADVYRGKVAPQRSAFKLALYIAFFPQLIAGPIVRYIDIAGQLETRAHSWDAVAAGFRRFILGLAKKVLIANQVAVFADRAFDAGSPASVVAWAGALCYALQIYYDFSGYSDMAIGLGRMFGFVFQENFNYPYTAPTVQNFWRRWHISLSGWFRDYVYIPLGGSRKGTARTYVNLLLVFLATGLWHGASWSFVVWGLYHGMFLTLERGVFGRVLRRLPRAVTRLYTLLAVTVGWVIFRAENMTAAAAYMKGMFYFPSGGWAVMLANMDAFILAALLIGAVGCAPVAPTIGERLSRVPAGRAAGMAGCFVLLALSVIFLTGSDFNPFLYFRF